MSVRGNVRKKSFDELSFEELSAGELSVWEMSSGNCQSGKSPSRNCPRTIYLVNNSVIPDNQSYKVNSRLSSLSFENDEILKLIRSFNIQKALGPDDISIRMIKICDSTLIVYLFNLYLIRYSTLMFTIVKTNLFTSTTKKTY